MKQPILLALLAWAATGALANGLALPGTGWQLLAIQSMDDAQGTITVPDPSLFTLAFGRDGRTALRLDCNRGMASYKVEPAGDGSSGALTFGPVAATRSLCPAPHLDQRLVRDLAHVRSYLLKDNKLYLSLMADGGIYEWAPAAKAAPDRDRVVKLLRFGDGKRATVIRDRVAGRHYIDYPLHAAAGQVLSISLAGSHRANYFNLLPPGSGDAAMAIGELSDNRFSGVLPDDGTYTIRVFLLRAAARRNEVSNFKLSLAIAGKALAPLSPKIDALVPGTRYHAQGTIPCQPAYSPARECEAGVIRRGHDGTATVELRWPVAENQTAKRHILFIKGAPKATDVPQAMRFSRNAQGWRVTFNGDEHFDIPEPLVFGG